jgi:hypothetical protein
MSKNKELAQDYFDRHQSSEECHITSDGRVFHNIGHAQSFAQALEDTDVESFKKAQFTKEATAKEPKVFTAEDLKDFDPEKTSYDDAKELVTVLGLTPASNKKVDYFACLIEAKSKIQE